MSELSLQDRYERVLRQIVDPHYVGEMDAETMVALFRTWASHVLEEEEPHEPWARQ